jgi:hypothetical protein
MKNVKKFLVAAVTGATNALALGLLPEPWDKWTVVGASVLGAWGVFAVKNGPA